MKKMTRWFAGIGMALCASLAFAGSAMAKLPADMTEFQARYSEEAKTPEGAAKLWLEAAFLYSDASTRDLGRQMLLVVMKDLPKDFDKNAAHSTMVERLKSEPHVQRSFCAGTSPENGYKADLNNCEITVTRSVESYGGAWNVFLQSSGADSPRQVSLMKVGDVWQVYQPAGLYMGIRPPAK